MDFRVQGFEFGKPNKNNRIYQQADVEKAIVAHTGNTVVTLDSMELAIPLDRVCASIEETAVDSKGVTVKAKILDTPTGDLVKGLLEQNNNAFCIVPVGTGVIDENGVVTKYTLSHYSFCDPSKC